MTNSHSSTKLCYSDLPYLPSRWRYQREITTISLEKKQTDILCAQLNINFYKLEFQPVIIQVLQVTG